MHRMHITANLKRMRSVGWVWGLTLALSTGFGGRASADLIRLVADRAYPDISADVNGVVNYTYNAQTQTGNFQVTNTPYLLAGGPLASQEFTITPDADGIRQQTVSIALDQNGNLISSPGNSYQLWGSVVAGGQTYTGLLLQGVPTAFGSLYRPPAGSQGSAIFDMNIALTGGALASAYGPDAYMSIQPEIQLTFTGSFSQNFSAEKATSNTRAYDSPLPFPAVEPTTLTILLCCGAGLFAVRSRKALRG
jgi:hypothetical protein